MTATASGPLVEPRGAGEVVVPEAVRPFAVVAAVAVIAGGLAAAVTRPTGWDAGSWVAAYLVLVVGVGQVGLAVGQSVLTGGRVGRATMARELALLNGGSALVVGGTLASAPLVTTLGGIVVAAALVTFLASVRGPSATDASVRAVRWIYALLLTTLIVSTPIGLVLAWLRA